ncbi:NAD-dependent epimerase/dehydratase family protein [Aliarcobacter butzleri]|uniref:NAD-dependent epimerase/dehydratase family protein n=1 Tax=Aliarcobacter butzleri TaxID=28197 RepID=UPI00263F657F|nr:NAD-dependent epimerase/dehydratase family protein [Aliarcobacter butzleri]MDN5067888.1 NAD-dependent epimerase/dehydratase family protein [Aliarcobacter butzleri]MDN5072710.1 NAD-dependent epimerase/dehydratase family protein [Aliarcobacter butzleri]MDN5121688.1 NAD-dependent epimerase/dehydratase family protein [Aliarcobacter butzleri]
MLTIIIGKRSNLSQQLSKSIDNCVLISSKSFEEELLVILNDNTNDTFNIIFNNFQNATKLNESNRLDEYTENAIFITSKILVFLQKYTNRISKIIYTSSSSVYGNNKFCSESDQVQPMNLHASLKVANEELIKKFCEANQTQYCIARIFNMYGGDDKFSIISKIKNSYVLNMPLKIVNGGTSIRDYVYIGDIVEVYKELLRNNFLPKILNVASGKGTRLIDIIKVLSVNGIKINTESITRNELKASIANIDLLDTFMDTSNFMLVENYLRSELK